MIVCIDVCLMVLLANLNRFTFVDIRRIYTQLIGQYLALRQPISDPDVVGLIHAKSSPYHIAQEVNSLFSVSFFLQQLLSAIWPYFLNCVPVVSISNPD